jgi:hypothetical protein
MNLFLINPNWDRPTINKISSELGLKESQIYKWNWDQKKKALSGDFEKDKIEEIISKIEPKFINQVQKS